MTNNINGLGFNSVGYNYTRQEEAAAQSAPEQGKVYAKENKQVNSEVVLENQTQAGNYNIALLNMQKAQSTQAKIDKALATTTPEQYERIANSVNYYQSSYDEIKNAGIEEGLSEGIANGIALTAMQKELEVL